MATWQELVQAFDRYQIVGRTDTSVTIVWRNDDGIRSTITVKRAGESILVGTKLVPVSTANVVELLKLTSASDVGCVVIEDDHCVLRERATLAALQADLMIHRVLALVAGEASRLRGKLRARREGHPYAELFLP